MEFFFVLQKVEEASEFAVSEAFSARNPDLPRKRWGQIPDLEITEQIDYHDEVYAEGERRLFPPAVMLTAFKI